MPIFLKAQAGNDFSSRGRIDEEELQMRGVYELLLRYKG